MNKILKLSVMAASFTVMAFMPASKTYATEIIVDEIIDSDQDILICDQSVNTSDNLIINVNGNSSNDILINSESNSEILIDDCNSQEIILDSQKPVSVRSSSGVSGIAATTNASDASTGVSVQNSVTPSYSEIGISSDNKSTNAVNTNIINTNRSNATNSSTDTTNIQTGKAVTRTVSSATQTLSVKNKDTQTKTEKNNKVYVTESMKRVLNAVNERRSKAGVGRVTFSDELNYVAALRVKEISKTFSHYRPNGRNWVTILSENGVDHDYAGENLACYVSSPEQVVTMWSYSGSHNRCMLNGDYSRAGVGTATVNGVTYWVLTLTD
ncbi:MAG: hypothetical protein K6E98_10925 [Lachnospiraceae bacterium]|nr:hypothetical protein [Lachnospiraceae bacterium]